ncbi:O-succinylhomoserine (thiol)-lyase [Agaricicola taiwanensis]|uniref:L-methionine gamma-lyase n=1 Tax=Agaricicola taiwanensis TaxID=591372 RepID=A0A8J3DZW0_9RHOB|nr:cystathionine gamma-synthase [Agaricicola taiwanensis]GGE52503.1 O-succinylhomoserine (thiol)-lyase [Agaricicola taiwanensis]
MHETPDKPRGAATAASKARAPQTVAATNGIVSNDVFGAVTPPLYLTSTFAFKDFEHSRGYDYSRAGNPSRDLLADTLARLEGGAGAVVVSSGMAAIDLVLSQLGRDDLVVAPHDCYGGTYRLLAARRDRGHFDVAFVDQNDAEALSAVLKRAPALVLLETPSNPLMRVVDIAAIAERAKAAGAKVAVDNTFLSPALQRPISLGADFVIHSTTKYLNGHSDVVGGAVIAADKSDVEALSAWASTTGVTGAPFDAYLTLRGLRSLFPRIERQQANAGAVADFLTRQQQVAAVHYPGLETHSGHAVAARQQSGFGAMLSFELAGGLEAARSFVEAVQVFTLAESLGGVESLVVHPATMTHASMAPEARRHAGIGDGLLRLSIGLEAEADLLNDIETALAAVSSRRQP